MNLAKPLGTEAYDISVPNANADKLDTAFGGMEAGLEYYFAQNGSGTFTGLNNLVGYIHNVTHIGENMRIVFKNTTANTGNVTINISGIGAIPILRKDSTQIPPGGLKANTVYMIYFDGTNFLLLGDGGEYGTAAAPQVLQGYTVGTEAGLVNGSIPTKNAQIFTPGTADQTINSGQYLGGVQTILGDSNLTSNNIRSGATLFGVQGTFSDMAPIITPSPTDIRSGKSAVANGVFVNGTLSTVNGGNTITPGTSNVTAVAANSIVNNTISVAGSANLLASNIKNGVNIFGVTGNLSVPASGTVTSVATSNPYTYYLSDNTTPFTATVPIININGLGFKPSKILIIDNNYRPSSLNVIRMFGVYSNLPFINPSQVSDVSYRLFGESERYYVITPTDITENSIKLPVSGSAGRQYTWEAYP